MSSRTIYQVPVDPTEWQFEGHTDIRFSWEYDDGSRDLLELYEKGKAQQWNATSRIDWSLEFDEDNPMGLPDEQIPIHGTPHWDKMTATEPRCLRWNLHSQPICQLMHGEQAALTATATLGTTVPV